MKSFRARDLDKFSLGSLWFLLQRRRNVFFFLLSLVEEFGLIYFGMRFRRTFPWRITMVSFVMAKKCSLLVCGQILDKLIQSMRFRRIFSWISF